MALPKQVQRQLEELNKIEERKSETPKKDVNTEPTSDVEEVVAESAPEVEEPVSEPKPEAVPQTKPDVGEEKWEHKYRRLQGKYDAEVPRLYSEVKELRAKLEELSTQKPVQEPTSEPKEVGVTQEEIDEYGSELIELQRKVAREVAAEFRSQITEIKAENATLKEQLNRVNGDSFQTKLLQAVPDFQEVDNDPAWIEWLNEYEPMLGGPRRSMAAAAFERGDVKTVKAYVDMFKQSRAPVQRPAPVSKAAELQRQVQPAKTSAQPTHAPQTKTYSQAEAQSMYERVRHLLNRGQLDAAQNLESEIGKAYAEGRVRA